MDYSLPGSSDHGIIQARILEWAPIFFSRGSSQPRDWIPSLNVSCIDRQVRYHWRHSGSPGKRSRDSKGKGDGPLLGQTQVRLDRVKHPRTGATAGGAPGKMDKPGKVKGGGGPRAEEAEPSLQE